MKRTPSIWSENHGKANFITEYPDYSMFAHLNKTAKEYPDYIATEFQGNKIKFAKMIEDIELISSSLLALGVKKGDFVSVVAPNAPQALFMVYAINRIGAVANMIHPLLSTGEIKQLIENVNSKAVLVFDATYPKIESIDWSIENHPSVIVARIVDALPVYLRPLYNLKNKSNTEYNPNHKIVSWKEFIANGKKGMANLGPDDGVGEDVAVILYSGGTTGLPKGVMLQNKAFNAMAVQASEIKPLDTTDTAGKKVLALMPLFHGFGLAMCMHVMISFGCHLMLVPKFDYVACAKLIFNKKINYIYAVPALYEALSRTEEIEKNDLSFIEMISISGDKCDKKLIDRMNKYLKKGNSSAHMMEAYGLTESVSGVCINPFFAMREGSAGIPFPDNRMKIVIPGTQEAAPVGEDGEICVTGPTLMKGYYNNEKETKLALQCHADGVTWLHTGDIGCMDEDGYLYYRQRYSRMIIISGNNVYPTQIENVINKDPDVNTSCVIGVDTKRGSTRIVAVVQPANSNADLDAVKKRILKKCEENVASFAVPQEVIFKNELPKTAMGKVSFKKLIEEYEKGEI